ncbi:MAG TPA: membrane protein insertase YidC [Marinagarivorans sp.]
MDWLRTSIIGGILVVTFLLIIRWNEFQERKVSALNLPPTSVSESANAAETQAEQMSEFDIQTPASASSVARSVKTPEQLIQVNTDTLQVAIDPAGGDIVKVALPKFNTELVKGDEQGEPFVLLEQTANTTYVARSGLAGANGTDSKSGRPTFSSSKDSYALGDAESLNVDLQYQQGPVQITKRFVFTRGSYLVTLQYIINNQSSEPWQASLVGSIKRDSHNPVVAPGIGMSPFLGAAITTDDKNYDKHSFDDIADNALEATKQGGWVAMIQHYFMSAWIPDSESQNTYTLRKAKNADMYFFSFASAPTTVAPGETQTVSAQFYAGPKDVSELEKIAPHLDLTVDYGFLWMIAKPLFAALDFIHSLVGNWGIAIVLLTLLIKILFFYPSAISYRSMAKMRKVQPKMQALKDTYGDDRQRMSQELMKLYKTEKVNPVAGCLPMLLQMPVFIALYWALMESVELRHASFLWLNDLSVKDPYFILPLVMGLTMWIQQHLNPTPPDPMQAKLMQWMPVIFTGLFMFFPAGLVVYWVVNNTLSIIQQYVITKQIENQK